MPMRKPSVMVRTLWLTLLAFSVGCADGPTTPTSFPGSPVSPMPPPSPTPAADGAIAGHWVGTFDTSDPADCHTNTPAQARFEQEGTHVVGTLSAVNACGLEGISFKGVFEEGRLEGSVTKGDFTGRITGTLSNGRLELMVSDLWSASGGGQIPAGEMHLHRL